MSSTQLRSTNVVIHIRYRGLWAQQNLAADAYLLVYDITNHDSLVALDYFNDIIEMESEERQTQPGAVPHVKIVAGNKCDLANSRQVSSQEGLAWARSHDCGCVSVFLFVCLYYFGWWLSSKIIVGRPVVTVF